MTRQSWSMILQSCSGVAGSGVAMARGLGLVPALARGLGLVLALAQGLGLVLALAQALGYHCKMVRSAVLVRPLQGWS